MTYWMMHAGQKKEELITDTGLTILHQPIEKLLESLERQLELLLVEVNQRIAAGENKHIKRNQAVGGHYRMPGPHQPLIILFLPPILISISRPYCVLLIKELILQTSLIM